MSLLKLSLRSWRQALVSQLMTSFAVSFLLLAMAILVWMEQEIRPVIERLQNENVLTAYLQPDYPQTQEKKLTDTIQTLIGSSHQRQAQVQMIQGEDFLKEMNHQDSALVSLIAQLGVDSQNLIPRFVRISGVFDSGLAQEIRALGGIESVETTHQKFAHTASAFASLQWLLRITIVGLFAALLIVVFHLTRSHSILFAETLHWLKLMGGSAFLMRTPALFSGLSVGFLGGLIASSAWIAFSIKWSVSVKSLTPLFNEMSLPSMFWAGGILGLSVLVGLISGWLGASK